MSAQKTIHSAIVLAFFGFFVAFATCFLRAAEPKPAIPWGSDLAAAFRDATVSGKPVLAHFYSNNCVPCKMLDAKAFQDPNLCQAMTTRIIPVKVNVDNHRDLAERYKVTRWPTDVYFFPNGTEIYRGVSPQDAKLYCDLVARVENRNREWISERIAAQQATENPTARQAEPPKVSNSMVERAVVSKSDRFQTVSHSPSGVIETNTATETNPYCAASQPAKSSDVFAESEASSPFQLVSRSVVAKENRYQSRTPVASSPTSPVSNEITNLTSSNMAGAKLSGVIDETATIDLDGFCPVSLLARREWILGNPNCAVKHRGRIYYFVNEDARSSFLEAPDRFAPVLSGFDIVLFLHTGKLEPGKREFGCWYALEGQPEKMFLFKSRESREQFNQERIRYAQSLGEQSGPPSGANEPMVANGVGNSSIAR